MDTPKHIHFMGIGGSSTSAAAQIAKFQGFTVSGCDVQADTPYLSAVKEAGIPVSVGHDASHLESADLVAVSPALFFQGSDQPEFKTAQYQNKLVTWQKFMGDYLMRDKFVICIAGTHGKSTTTTLAALLLEKAQLDPTAQIGAIVPTWHTNVRLGHSKFFVSEADEYYGNFLNYHPNLIILNNIEMDHPEYFHTENQLLESYQEFINHLQPEGQVILNADSPLNLRMRCTGPLSYHLSDVKIVAQTPQGTDFIFDNYQYHLALPGLHNVANALGIIHLANYLQIAPDITNSVLSTFTGLARRLELVGVARGITVLDDYANHPTAFAATTQAAQQKYPNSNIYAVIEPHTFSRLRAVLPSLAPALKAAHQVIISQIYPSREPDPGNFTGADIAAAIPEASYIPDFADITSTLVSKCQKPDVILVMGSGNSYKLARQIYQALADS